MAGLGYKDFTAGAVLTAAQVDGYLMEQSVMNFAGTAARGSALASVLSAGQVAHVGGGTLTVYDGSNWQQFAPIGAANRNILFNGAMQVSQRGTSTASITADGYYTADRWGSQVATLGTWTQSVENDAPTGSGFRRSLKMLCTTADASPAAGDFLAINQYLEGQDLQRILKGTSSAQQVTASFWVKANVTGTYVCYLFDNDNTRVVSASYTISASATWERKTITFPADTTGALDNDNAKSFQIHFVLAAGSSFTSGSLGTTWAAYSAGNLAVGQTNLAAAINNYWQVTGVQLEVGSQATAFEFKSYGQELRECQRYYWRNTGGSTFTLFGTGGNVSTSTSANANVQFPGPMRAKPTSVDSSAIAMQDSADTVYAITAASIDTATTSAFAASLVCTIAGATIGRGIRLLANNNTAAYLGFSAEL